MAKETLNITKQKDEGEFLFQELIKKKKKKVEEKLKKLKEEEV